MKALTSTQYFFNKQTAFYRGKVRDVYTIADNILVIVATDRISAFDHVLPKSIPYKGQVLTEIASMFLDLTTDIVPNWKLATPDPHVTVGKRCDAIPIEFVVRQYLTGHAWRIYRDGGRLLCGNVLPDGLKENDKLPQPIVTPATKAISGHDEDISAEEILSRKLLSPERWEALKNISLRLFQRGTEYAASKGLILVDTKYEFGFIGDTIYLIDEIHTPDSSRYFYADGFEERQANGEAQKQLSKEFVREWLMKNGFQGKEGQQVPTMTDEVVQAISERYIELYEQVSGKQFHKQSVAEADMASILDQAIAAL
ncbi:MAG: phosphoribosylaminoimidazolesuccinocarboxamide synthase [Bacteroidetes bacterium]|nr:phosphoribosylaminoimidazolesuccinocarboxamide synthase [Bacteroidota bacterium]